MGDNRKLVTPQEIEECKISDGKVYFFHNEKGFEHITNIKGEGQFTLAFSTVSDAEKVSLMNSSKKDKLIHSSRFDLELILEMYKNRGGWFRLSPEQGPRVPKDTDDS